jgi:hypothetical protein
MTTPDRTPRLDPGPDDTGGSTTIPLSVSATDHPSAILYARLAPQVLGAASHLDDLDTLDPTGLRDLLAYVSQAGRINRQIEDHLIVAARRPGPGGDAVLSWTTLAQALGLTHKSGAQDRYRQALAGTVTDQVTKAGSWVHVVLCVTGHTAHEGRHGRIVSVDDDGRAHIRLGTDPAGTLICQAAQWSASTLPEAVQAQRAWEDDNQWKPGDL